MKNLSGKVTTWLARKASGLMSASPANVRWGGKFNGLINQYPGAAAAYSLRKLAPGPVVELQRGNGDERDFTEGELVSQVGGELITNGGFDGTDGWAVSGSGVGNAPEITGGEAVWDGTQTAYSAILSDYSLTQKKYIVKFDIICSDYSVFYFQFSSTGLLMSELGISSGGTYELFMDFTESNADRFRFYTDVNGVTATIDNVSVKEVTPSVAEAWVHENGLTLSRGVRFGKLSTTSANATVSTWYDQSGNGNDATQTTRDAQPTLIKAGVTQMENGKPAIVFDGSTTLTNSSYSGTLRTDSFYVMQTSDDKFYTPSHKADGAGVAGYLADASSTSNNRVGGGYNSGSNQLFVNGSDSVATNRQEVHTALSTASQLIRSDIDATTLNWTGIAWGADYASSEFSGTLQEWIIYPFDQSANRIGIETNINGHYGIYFNSEEWVDSNFWDDAFNWQD